MTAHEHAFDASPANRGKRLTGVKVLGMLVAFFGVVASVNGVMIYFALSTFRGEAESHAYERGLAYNHDIEAARAQSQRDWRVEAKVTHSAQGEAGLRVAARDPEGKPVTGVALQAVFASPADKKQDVSLPLAETTPGHFEGDAKIADGWRDLVLTATRDGREVFRSKSRIFVGAHS